MLLNPRQRLFLAIAVSAVVLVAQRTEAQPSCDGLGSPRVRVFGAQLSGIQEMYMDASRLRQLTDDLGLRRPDKHPFIVILPNLTTEVIFDKETAQLGDEIYCATPQNIALRFGLTEYKVYIDDRAQNDECIRKELEKHAGNHLRVDEGGVAKLLIGLKEPLREELAVLRRSPEPSAAAVTNKLQTGLRNFLRVAAQEFQRQLPELHRLVDTPEEIQRLELACDGRLKSLGMQDFDRPSKPL